MPIAACAGTCAIFVAAAVLLVYHHNHNNGGEMKAAEGTGLLASRCDDSYFGGAATVPV